ncbi:MAG: hypothetical protein ACXW18_12395 [Pyrinomonadaceae bacterium]
MSLNPRTGVKLRRTRPAYLASLLFAAIAVCSASGFAGAQMRDHLTEKEKDLVRDNQILDKRIDVFIKAADRRLAIIRGAVPPPAKKSEKDEEKWGEMPSGSKTQLLSDIAGILDESITNIDDVSRRDEKNPLISRSLRKLTAAANNYVAQLTALRDQTKDADELAAIERVLENAVQIIEVGSNLPAEAIGDKKKKKP